MAYLHFAFVGHDPESPPLITTAALARTFDQLTGSVGKTTRVFVRGKTTITVLTGLSFAGGGVSETGSEDHRTGVSDRTYHLPDPDPYGFVEPARGPSASAMPAAR